MKILAFSIFCLACTLLSAQSNTEVYLFELNTDADKVQLNNLKNISNNDGYDNQPSFFDNNTVLFSSTRNKQTDIALYRINDGNTRWITNTSIGSEYSPLKIPGKEAVSAIRLDTTNLQRLYQYDLKDGTATTLITDLKIGYHVWYDEHTLVSSVLVDSRMDLVISNLKEKTHDTIQKSVGRSLHKIPGTDLISFISKENEIWSIKSVHPKTKEIKLIKTIPLNINDMCWLSNGTLIMPLGKMIAKFNPNTDKDWSVFYRFTEKEINEITRIMVSPDGKHLALVSEESPGLIVQKQVETFNKGDVDGFASCYSDDVVIKNFPKDTISVGNAALKSSYQDYMSNNVSTVSVVKRIIIGNVVIDEEKAIDNGKEHQQVAIYEVEDGKISSMTFIHPQKVTSNVEAIVQQQVDAYNARDIEAFSGYFADTISVFNFPYTPSFQGQEALKKMFSGLFSKTPDLHSEVKNRIVIGNIVIDEESVTANGDLISAVAIYQIENDKIAKMFFLQ